MTRTPFRKAAPTVTSRVRVRAAMLPSVPLRSAPAITDDRQLSTAGSGKAEAAGSSKAPNRHGHTQPTTDHQENTMTLQTERPATREATATLTYNAPRGGGYVTVPGNRHDAPRTEGTYVSQPGGYSGNGEKVRGRYVTLHTAPLDETEGSYTRRG